MNKRLLIKSLRAVLLTAALILALVPAQRTATFAQQAGSKADLTPIFWQRDPDADFEDEGRMHCAPTAVSDGLIYLARANGWKDLVPGTRKKEDQINLIKELAEEFGTDPSIGGTNPDKILTGLQSYMSSKGYEFNRLEVMTWRSLSAGNKKFRMGTKPDMAWMRNAARSKDTVVIFNFGWYREGDGGYVRKGGHWVSVVGAGGANEFMLHNPILRPEQQTEKQSLILKLLDEDFIVPKDSGEANMKGYYEGEGPGLPHGDSVSAILDAVIVFSLKKE